MKPDERTYAIQNGDTLQKVAQQLGMTPQELRRFHNIYCEIPDLIEADFPQHLKIVLLSPDKNDTSTNNVTEKKPKKVSFIKGYCLPFLPANIKKNYDVVYVLEDGEEKDTLRFESSVKWLGADPKGFHFFEIDRLSKISINNAEPDTIMEELAVKTAEVLYPLQIIVDDTGKWIDIHNYKEIVDRWETTKSEVLDYYEGEVADIYVEHTENSLTTRKVLMASFRSDLFLRTLFNGIHVDYTAEHTFTNTNTFPLVKDE